jgi:FkbM family methyltransferase
VAIDFESKVQALYEQVLKKGDVAVDVGAHGGRHLFPMAKKVGPTGHVYAFEPIPAMHGALGQEIVRHGVAGMVDLYAYAASSANGEAEFVVAMDALEYSGLKERRYDFATRLERIKVTTRTLDSVLPTLDRMSFLKIDVEGAEWDVIRGAAGLIERLRPVVGFEFGYYAYQHYDVDPNAVYDFFDSRRYALWDILGKPMQDRAQFVESSRKQDVWDYAAVPREAAGSGAGYFAGTR